jgi:hypothetical protein
MQFPDAEVVSYKYDSAGGQQEVSAGGDVIVQRVQRNAKGQTTSVELGNGVKSEHRYDDGGDLRLRQIVSTHRPSGRVLQAYDYDFDGVGNVRQILDYCNPDTDECPCDPTPGASCAPNRLSRAFDYDEMDRLVGVRAPDGMSIAGLPRSYAYDAIDNLTQKGGASQTYGAEGKPHAVASAAGVSHRYDANGNLISTSAGLSLTWNAMNMPVLTVKNGQRVRKDFVGESVWKKVEEDTTTYYLPSMRIENGRVRKYYGGYAERDPGIWSQRDNPQVHPNPGCQHAESENGGVRHPAVENRRVSVAGSGSCVGVLIAGRERAAKSDLRLRRSSPNAPRCRRPRRQFSWRMAEAAGCRGSSWRRAEAVTRRHQLAHCGSVGALRKPLARALDSS